MAEATRTRENTASPLYMSLELGKARWVLSACVSLSGPVRHRTVRGGDCAAVLTEIAAAKRRFGLAAEAPVWTCYEAGRDGFWIHRWLTAQGAHNLVVDASSLEVSRRARRVKTDRVDGAGLLRRLVRWVQGERGVWQVVRVPTAAEEDARAVPRALATVTRDRVRVKNRITSLLATVGAVVPVQGPDFLARLAATRTGDGAPMPPGLQQRVAQQWALWTTLTEHRRQLRRQRQAALRTADASTAVPLARLQALRGVGATAATTFVHEAFGWRAFRNRRQVGALFGLTPTPWRSGALVVDHGISRAGSPTLRALAVEIAWSWLRFQPDSALTQWYVQRFAAGGPRPRRIGIVALARRLMIALWRYATTGVVPAGAMLKPTRRAA